MKDAVEHCTKVSYMGLGQHRRRGRAGRGHRVRGRYSHLRSAGGGGDPARALHRLEVRFINVVDLFRLMRIANTRTV